MIIGNNQNLKNDHFQEKFKVIQEEAKKREIGRASCRERV